MHLKLPYIAAILLALALTALVAAAPAERPLHHKSALGLMPPAYGLDPAAPASLAVADAPSVPFLGRATSTPVGSWAQVLAVADFTGDGQNDAAIATAGSFDAAYDARLHLFSGWPLTRTQQRAGGDDPSAIVAADLNSDGRSDVALALESDDALNLYTQHTDQGVNEAVTIPLPGAPDALAVGDFTGERRADLAVIAPLSGTISLWQSDADGLTRLPFDLPFETGGFDALAVGDLNNDGQDDLAALRGAGFATESLVIFLQDDGFFPERITLTPETGGFLPHSLTIDDINGDGLDDVLVTAGGNEPDAFLNVFLQGSSGLAETPVTYPAYHLPSALATGDIDHDGRTDVVVVHDSWRTLSVYTQTVSNDLAPYTVAAIPYSDRYRPDALTLADLDGTGSLDIALVDRDHGLTVLTSTLTVPLATITQPAGAQGVVPAQPPGALTVGGAVSAGAAGVQVRLRGATEWISATVTGETWQTTLTTPADERSWWIEARAIDTQGQSQSPPARLRIGIEADAIGGRVIINDDAYATNNPDVTLTLPIADPGTVAAMRLSMDASSDSDWIPYAPTSSWMLSTTEGIQTVYAQFRDAQGTESAIVSDDIILDTQPPTSTITTETLAGEDNPITLAWSGEDSGSGIASYDLEMSDVVSATRGVSPTWERLLWQTAVEETTFAIQPGHSVCFRLRARDQAGNVEVWSGDNGDICLAAESRVYLPVVQG